MTDKDELRQQVERQVKRIKKAEREKPTLTGQTVFIGTLGLLLILPIVGGAYLGDWLDSHSDGYSIHWTLTFILVGVVVGMINVYLFIREQ
jgi:ATP synthase protein I